MEKEEFRKYVKLMVSMCTDYLSGNLDKDTYLSNLTAMLQSMEEGE